MADKGVPNSGEGLQIVILTLFMTSGFFAIFSLVLMFMTDGKADEVSRQLDDLKRLRMEIKKNGELWKLREDVLKLQENDGEEEDDTLRGLVDREAKNSGINLKRLAATRTRAMSKRGSTEEHSQLVEYSGLDTSQLLTFVGSVKERRQSVKLASLEMNRDRSSTAEEPTWNGRATFKLYENPVVKKQLKEQRARLEAAKKAAASKEQ